MLGCVGLDKGMLDFYALDFEEVVMGLAKLIRPVSVFDFGKLLMENLSCRGTYSRDKYQSYYEALLTYFEDFTLLFRLLSEDNSKFVPPMEDKNFGLLQIMSGHIDEAYWIRTKAEIPVKSYKNIHEFITCFKEVMTIHYEAYLRYSVIPSERDRKFGRRDKRSEADSHGKSEREREHRRDRDKQASSPRRGFFNRGSTGNGARKLNAVNYTSDEEELPSTKRGHDTDEYSDASSDRRSEDQDSVWVKSVSEEEDHGTEIDKGASDILKQEEDSFQEEMHQIFAIGQELNKSKTTPVCIAAAVYGDCYREKTDLKHSRTFSHSKSDTAALAEKIYSRLHERFGGKKPAYSGPPNAKVDLGNKADTRKSLPNRGYDSHNSTRVNKVTIKSKSDT